VIGLRSLAFNTLAALWTVTLLVVCVPLLAWRRGAAWSMAFWARGIELLLAHVVGLRWTLEGAVNLPASAAIVAANHQSAWETVMLHRILRDPAFVLKRELMFAPHGWYAWRAGAIPVNRAGGAPAMRAMVVAARRALKRGQTVVIFPQGTRTAPGVRRPFHPGVAALYRGLGVPVVPIAHNAGSFWGRKTFLKRPGTVTVAVLPATTPGLDRERFMNTLTATIERAAERLTARALLEQNVNEDHAASDRERTP